MLSKQTAQAIPMEVEDEHIDGNTAQNQQRSKLKVTYTYINIDRCYSYLF